MTGRPRPPDDLAALARMSAKIGADPLLVQAAGGNTSIKDGDVMWIKASGTRLADAETRDIFVPVDLPGLRDALDNPDVDADRPVQFALGGGGLRPSIETALHAVFERRVVLHVHCVSVLSHAIRTDPAASLAPRLTDFDWRLIPYVKPGATLAALSRAALGPATDVAVLANHGLVVAADGIDEAAELLDRVVNAARLDPAAQCPVDMEALGAHCGQRWHVPPADAPVHQLALVPDRLAQATGGSLYPDHVIFCGVGAIATKPPLPDDADAPAFLLVPGMGAAMRADASSGARALANCLGDVLSRTPPDASLTYLTQEQNAELLGWDAEKYRRRLDG